MSLSDLSAVEARRLIGAGEISPKELCAACIARIEQVNGALNAIVTTDFERAMARAALAEAEVRNGAALGPLHGLPIAIKDLNETAGLRTTHGSKFFADHIPERDDDIVARIRAAGAVIIGKTNTPEFGAGGNTVNDVFGATRNPYDNDLTCGGSSGGSAAALASRMVPLANGSDLGGSLRIPAAFCGVVGFRPSPGVVGNATRPQGWSPWSVQGPMGRSVDDAALLFSALAGDSHGDPLGGGAGPPPVPIRPADLSTLRVGISEDLGFAPVDNEVRSAFKSRIERISGEFRSVQTVEPALENANEVFRILRAVKFVACQRQFYDADPDRLERNTRTNVEDGLKLSLADVAWAELEATRIYRAFQKLFESIDLFICPAVAVSPFPADQLFVEAINGERLESYFHWLALTYGITLTTNPALALPCGMLGGAPFSLQLVGPRRGDGFVLSAAKAMEDFFAGTKGLATPPPSRPDTRAP